MSEIINYTRLTTSDKLSDKFVTCQAYSPQDRDKSELGMIFSQIEINSPWFPTSQVGQTVINTLIKEYYRGNDSSDLVNFEEAIKKVNEALAYAAQGGETDWIGKFSGVLVLINKSEIHFAQTGKSHAYLYRGGKVNHITEGLESEDAPHPLKTFSNLTSGSLQEGDKIVIANNPLFEIINPNELKWIVSSLPPALAAIECAKILQNHGSQDANGIFLELTTREKYADLAPDQKVEAVYIDQQILTLGRMSKNIFSNIGTSFKNTFSSGTSKLSKFSEEKFKPIAKKGLEISKEKSKHVFEATKTMAKTRAEKISEKVEDISTEQGHHEKKSTVELAKVFLAAQMTKLRNKIRRPLIKIGFYTKKKSKMYLALLILVLLVLTGAVYFSLRNKNSKVASKQAEQAYNQIVSLSGEAEILKGKNQSEEALSKYATILELKEQLKGTKYEALSTTTIEKANKAVADLARLRDLAPQSQAEAANLKGVAYIDKTLFAVAGADLMSIKSDGKSFAKIASLGTTMDQLTQIDELGIIAGTASGKLISFNTSGNEYKKSDADIGTPTNLTSYGSNVYLIDKKAGKLWKVPYSEGNFQSPSSYFKEDIDVSALQSFTVDGSLYTLSSKGEVKRYSRGNAVSDFTISLPDKPKIQRYLSIITTEDADRFFVILQTQNALRLVELKKDGQLINQYQLTELNDFSSATASPDMKIIYIVSGNRVLTYNPI